MYNPFGTPSNVKPGWSGIVGQDYPTQHAGPNIDFGVMHFWPNNWATIGVHGPDTMLTLTRP